MDGSGRWAESRGLPRAAGHQAGVDAVRAVVRAAQRLGICTLTLFAFSSLNWRRPRAEVSHVLGLVRDFLGECALRYRGRGVRVRLIGRRDRLPAPLLAAARRAEHATAGERGLELRLAVDYSARAALLGAARAAAPRRGLTEAGFARCLAQASAAGGAARDVDLLIRTGGEHRLSDFLLWECAQAELLFTATPWPAFGARDLAAALREFRVRDRRFGGLAQRAAG
jgi:undecaprenyl diphosphate synthase